MTKLRIFLSTTIMLFILISIHHICFSKEINKENSENFNEFPIDLNLFHPNPLKSLNLNDKNFSNLLQYVDFSSPVLVSDSLEYAYSPNLIELSDNSILVVYSAWNLTTRLSTDSGETWEPPDVNYDVWCNYSLTAFKDNSNIIHVYYLNYNNIFHTSSSDNGGTWQDAEILYTFQNPPNPFSFEANRAADSSIWFNYYCISYGEAPHGYLLRQYPNGYFADELSLTPNTSDSSYSGSVCSLPQWRFNARLSSY